MSKTKSLTIAERDARIAELAKYSQIALEGMPAHQLRDLLRGVVLGFSSMNKATLIENALAVTNGYKQQSMVKIANALEAMGENDLTYAPIQACYQGDLDAKEAAKLIYDRIMVQKHKDTTVTKTKPKQLRAILAKLKLVEPESQQWADNLYAHFLTLIRELTFEINGEYKYRNDNRTADDFKRVDGDAIAQWATNVLEYAASDDNSDSSWHKVSLALAITSGRRQAEIHGTTQYELVDSKTIRAIGLVKKKTDDFELEFQPISDAETWLKALNSLPENRRNQDKNRVNGTIRKSIEGSLKSKMNEFGFSFYKDSRDFYINYNIDRNFNRRKHGAEATYVMRLVGHEDSKSALSYTKMFTTLEDN